MRKILFFVVLSALCYYSACAQDGAQIKFINQDTVFDFGVIHEFETTQYQFEFRNTGTEGLTITGIVSDNKNIGFQWPRKIIKPGKKGLITATYTAKDGIGSFKNDAVITSNATKAPYPFLHISGAILPSKDNTPTGAGGSSSKRRKGR